MSMFPYLLLNSLALLQRRSILSIHPRGEQKVVPLCGLAIVSLTQFLKLTMTD